MNGITFNWTLIKPGVNSSEYNGVFVNGTNKCKIVQFNIYADGKPVGFNQGRQVEAYSTVIYQHINTHGSSVQLIFSSVKNCTEDAPVPIPQLPASPKPAPNNSSTSASKLEVISVCDLESIVQIKFYDKKDPANKKFTFLTKQADCTWQTQGVATDSTISWILDEKDMSIGYMLFRYKSQTIMVRPESAFHDYDSYTVSVNVWYAEPETGLDQFGRFVLFETTCLRMHNVYKLSMPKDYILK